MNNATLTPVAGSRLGRGKSMSTRCEEGNILSAVNSMLNLKDSVFGRGVLLVNCIRNAGRASFSHSGQITTSSISRD